MPAYAPASADESDCSFTGARVTHRAQASTPLSRRSPSRSSRTTGRATRTSRASPSRPLATDAWGNFVCSAGDGECKRAAEATVPINDKMIVLGLQAHNYWGGLISYFNADRGGQAYAYKPELP